METYNPYTEEQRQQLEQELHRIIEQAVLDIERSIEELKSMQKTDFAIPYFQGVQWSGK